MLFTPVFKSLFVVSSIMLITSCNNGEAAEKTQTVTDTIPQKTAAPAGISSADIKFGKYGCTATKYSNGSTEYVPRGFLTLDKTGSYTYEGFEDPSRGKYTVDEKGNLHFTGGYLDGGEATKIDRPNKYFLTFPTNPDNRWTMGWIE